jgi:hypothetical protein
MPVEVDLRSGADPGGMEGDGSREFVRLYFPRKNGHVILGFFGVFIEGIG